MEVWLNGGTAEPGLDFDIFSGIPQFVTFEPGQTIATIELDVFDDFDLEGTETVGLRLQTTPGIFDTVIGDQDTASLDIRDNEVSYIEFAETI